MKKISKLNVIGLACIMSFCTIQLSGQGGQRPGGGPGGRFQQTEEDIKERVDNLGNTLEFSDDQHKKILDYEVDFNNRMQIEFQKFRNQSGPPPDREAMRANMMKFREERDKKYKAVLTADQLEKYTVIQEQRRSEMRRQYQENGEGGQRGQDGQPGQGGDRPERGRGRN